MELGDYKGSAGDGFFTTFLALTTLGEIVAGDVTISVARAVSEPGLAALLATGLVLMLVSFRGARSALPTTEVKS